MGKIAGNDSSAVYTYEIDLTQATAVTGVFKSAANPAAADLLVLGVSVRVTTGSTGASTVDIGVAADATTSNDTSIDGLSLATAGLFNNVEDPGTNGELNAVWGASQYLNIAEASGDVAGVIGTVYVTYCYA